MGGARNLTALGLLLLLLPLQSGSWGSNPMAVASGAASAHAAPGQRSLPAPAAPGPVYSQNCEDLYAYWSWFADRSEPGFFVELGALDGVRYSNTLFFEETLKWDGLLLEGSSVSFASLCCNCRRVLALHAAVCNATRTVHFVEGAKAATGGILEFMSADHMKKHLPKKKHKRRLSPVACAPLRDTFARGNVTHVDFFSLDVEGAELDVLQTIDWTQVCAARVMLHAHTRPPPPLPDNPQNGCTPLGVTHWLAAAPVPQAQRTRARAHTGRLLQHSNGPRCEGPPKAEPTTEQSPQGGATLVADCCGRRGYLGMQVLVGAHPPSPSWCLLNGGSEPFNNDDT